MSRPLNEIFPELGLSDAEMRLKSVVRSDESHDLALVDVETDVRYRGQSAKTARDALTFKQVHVDLL